MKNYIFLVEFKVKKYWLKCHGSIALFLQYTSLCVTYEAQKGPTCLNIPYFGSALGRIFLLSLTTFRKKFSIERKRKKNWGKK
jgi:hypothetical protein